MLEWWTQGRAPVGLAALTWRQDRTSTETSGNTFATAYDTGGRPYLFTSYNAASGGGIVNQVQDAFNGLGQLITEYQATVRRG
jgi:hypothetical protein